MNMLLTGHSGLDLSLIITRDRLEPGESFEAFVDRQIKAVTLQVSKFSIQEKHAQKAPDRDDTIAVELAQQFTQNGQVIHQRQRTWLLPDAASVLRQRDHVLGLRVDDLQILEGDPSPTAHREAETAKAHRG